MTAISANAGTDTAAVVETERRRYRDPKKLLWIGGLAVPLLPFGAVAWAERSGSDVPYWAGPIWIFLLIPLFDTLLGTDKSNPPDWAVPQLEESRWYRILTWLYLPIQFAGLIWACHFVATNDLSWFAQLGFALTVGTVAGIAINTAHELGHKRGKLERRLSKIALAQSAYGHFYVEHNRGHHSRVSTPEDPATARFGESFWEFLPRTVIGSLRSAWELEMGRLERKGLRWWSPRNEILNAWALTVVLFGGLILAFGPGIIPFLAIQAVFGFCLLEVVNYVEHYGLLRQKVANGRYERCKPEHSWNSNNIASNLVLYHLERHSDHHANPTRRYQSLRHFDDAPQLPSGYGLMIGLALVPPVWRRVMDHRVLDHYDGDISRANIHPRVRNRVLARYGAVASA